MFSVVSPSPHRPARASFSPIKATSRKPYSGINTVCLWAAAQAKRYERGEWATYQRWQDQGAQVRKGEKATLRRPRRWVYLEAGVAPELVPGYLGEIPDDPEGRHRRACPACRGARVIRKHGDAHAQEVVLRIAGGSANGRRRWCRLIDLKSTPADHPNRHDR